MLDLFNEPILDFLDTKSIAIDVLDTNLASVLRHLAPQGPSEKTWVFFDGSQDIGSGFKNQLAWRTPRRSKKLSVTAGRSVSTLSSFEDRMHKDLPQKFDF